MSRIPLVDLKAAYTSQADAIDAALHDVIANTRFIHGEELGRFEAAFAAFCGTRYAVGVGSGTAAIHLALAALGVGPGDEVAVPAQSFIATAEPVSWLGARPRFIEVDSATAGMDPDALKANIADVKAVLPVHLFGHPVDLAAISEVAATEGVPVVEDAAQAQGAQVRDSNGSWVTAGGYGEIGCFSFYPAKNLGAFGDAGAITTNDPDLAEKISMLRNHGRTTKYEHLTVGYAHRMDTIQAAVLGVKLTRLAEGNERRRALASAYRGKLTGVGDLTLPIEQPYARSVYHLYVIRTSRRDELLAHLNANGIGAGIHYPVPLHLQPAYASLGHRPGDFPIAEAYARECLSLPIYPEFSENQQDRVVEAVRDFFETVS